MDFELRGKEFKGIAFFASRNGKADGWAAKIQPQTLAKSSERNTIPGAVWFSGMCKGAYGSSLVFGCLTPQSRDSWLQFYSAPPSECFADEDWAEEVARFEHMALVAERAETFRSLNNRFTDEQMAEAIEIAETLSLERHGQLSAGTEIVFSVLEKLAQSS